jgi:hypothetical protein
VDLPTTAVGSFSGNLTITSNDVLVQAFDVALTGTVGPAVTSTPTNTGISEVPTTFTVGTSVPNATVTWNFGDGTTGTGSTVTHVYATTGTFTVTFTITDPATGATTTGTQTVTISDLTAGQVVTVPGTLTIEVKKGNFKFGGKTASFQFIVPFNVTTLTGQTLSVTINGYSKTFTLDKRGAAKTAEEMVSLKANKKPSGTATLKLTLKSSAAVALLSQGVTLDAQGRPKKVLVLATFGGQTGSFISTIEYTKGGVGKFDSKQ